VKRFKFQKDFSKLSKSSGVYSFKTKGEFLYIGKAANLKERVKNHFQQPTYKDLKFIDKIDKIGFIKTENEIEALILEAELIKKHLPKFNVLWRDDKNYFYVRVQKETFPRLLLIHQKKEGDIGPFVDGKALKETLKVLRKVFPYRSCRNIPKKSCLWHQLNRCPAPCSLKTKVPEAEKKIEKESKRNIKNLIKILKGQKNQVLKNLKREMKKDSKELNFEGAARARDQIKNLEKVLEHKIILSKESNWPETEKILQKIIKTNKPLFRIEAYDVSNFQGKEAVGAMIVFIEGEPRKHLYRKFKIRLKETPDDIAMLKEIINRRLKHKEWPRPNLVLIDGGKAQLNTALIMNSRIIALAKRKNEVFVDNKKKVLLKSLPREIRDLILQLRDEAHRSAITYHRKLRKKKLIEK